MMTQETIQPEKHSRLYWTLADSAVLIQRSLKHIIKSPDQLMAVAFQPIMFMLLFRYVFGGAIQTGGTTYVNYLVAGILIQTAAFGSTTTSIGVANDLQKGIIERLKSLPTVSSAVMTGHVVADLARNTMSSVVMILVGLLVGFRPTASVGEWLMILGLLLLFTFAMSWLSAIMGLMAKTVESVQWMGFIFVFPLTFASSAFVPTAGMPKGLRVFAENQPVTHVIEAIRGWMVGTPVGDHAWIASIWCVGIILFSIPVASIMFRKHQAK